MTDSPSVRRGFFDCVIIFGGSATARRKFVIWGADRKGDCVSERPRATIGFLPWWPDNPYQILLKRELNALGLRVIGNPPHNLLRILFNRDGLDVVHVHWPHGTYKTWPRFFFMVLVLIAYRLLKNNIVWTVHELDAYESRHPRRDEWFRRLVMKLSRQLIVHGEYTRQELAADYGTRARLRSCATPPTSAGIRTFDDSGTGAYTLGHRRGCARLPYFGTSNHTRVWKISSLRSRRSAILMR